MLFFNSKKPHQNYLHFKITVIIVTIIAIIIAIIVMTVVIIADHTIIKCEMMETQHDKKK